MKPTTLPETLHETLTLAISDSRSLNRTLYEPRYFYWHTPDEGKCCICLAGGILAGTLRTDRYDEIIPTICSPEIDRKLRAIDCCRIGDWYDAFATFHNVCPSTHSKTRLESLDSPSDIMFNNWESFDSHLRSYESILPLLAAIEREELTD